MLLSFAIITILVPTLFTGCSENNISYGTNRTQLSFPEFFIEQGSDLDTTYISLRGLKIADDSLEIQATSWGIIETGLFLEREDYYKEIRLRMMGECGTVSSITWEKVTFKKWITAEETQRLQKISFTNFRDTIEVVKTSTN